VSEIGLFVVEGTQQKVKDGVLHHHASIGLVLLDHVSVVHGPVVFTDGKVRSFVLVHIDHDSTKREKKRNQLRHFVQPKESNKYTLVKFQLKVVRVLFFKEFDADLLRNDLRADKVFLCETKPHLFENELDL
jgi:hypothetical protein